MAAAKVRVRMYEVGFGDCFLLTLPTTGGPRKVLVDCGSIKKGTKPFAEILKQLFADLKQGEPDGKARVDVVIATHRHKDHISGFEKPDWRDVEVGEVWLPWTEDPSDPTANQLRASLVALAQRLRGALGRSRAGLASLDVLMANALENEAAMNMLRKGFHPHRDHGSKTKRIYLPNVQLSRTLRSQALPGVDISVMGPSRDRADISYMEPRANDTHYLRFAGEPASPSRGEGLFLSRWTHTPERPPLTAREIEEIAKIGSGHESAVAAWIDAALNNTSLMLMLEVQGKHLFLPGDSQWGPWMRALKDPGWQALLRKTRLYKVGHHGSYNATPPDFVQNYLGASTWNLISVTPHGSYKKVPKPELVTDLKKKQRRVIRSDEDKKVAAAAAVTVRAGISIDVAL